MEPFEYVSVLTSLILGLGITQLLSGVASMILVQHRVKIYVPYLLWVILVFGFHVQEWWNNFEHSRTVLEWRLRDFFFLVMYPIVLFVLAKLLSPSLKKKKPVDLKKYYFRNYRIIFLVGLFLPLISIPQNMILSGHSLIDQSGQIVLAILFLIPIITKTKSPIYHYSFAIFGLFAGLFYLFYYNPTL